MSDYFEAEYSQRATKQRRERERERIEADAAKYKEIKRIIDNYDRATRAMIEAGLIKNHIN